MPEKTETTDVSPDLRNQLAKRLAVAGGLVAILLGMLAIFDHFSQPTEERELQIFTQPVPVAPRKMVTQPVTPAEIEPEPPLEEASVAPVAGEEPPPPVVAADPVAEPARIPAAATRPAVRATTPAKEPTVVPEMTSSPPIVPGPLEQPLRKPVQPTARVIESTPAATPAPAPASVASTGAPRLFSGFVLQAGVFASAQRAEELHAKLTLSGVPSQIETRVQVGPFRTRKEAIAAQAQLQELGIDTILVAPKSGR